MTVQIPTGQVGWFEQMLRSMGWAFRKEEAPASVSEPPRVFEAEVDAPPKSRKQQITDYTYPCSRKP